MTSLWRCSDDLGRPEEEDGHRDWVLDRSESCEAETWQVISESWNGSDCEDASLVQDGDGWIPGCVYLLLFVRVNITKFCVLSSLFVAAGNKWSYSSSVPGCCGSKPVKKPHTAQFSLLKILAVCSLKQTGHQRHCCLHKLHAHDILNMNKTWIYNEAEENPHNQNYEIHLNAVTEQNSLSFSAFPKIPD